LESDGEVLSEVAVIEAVDLLAGADPGFQFAGGSQKRDARPFQLEICIL